ncbi:anti-sigma regulatory factor (Ser/Thr protein kinase) [Nocardiopsis mwathae]|uniref:Anti-sigma regulatory factor (Ser/Thr protein kinase) n=1 Tax=Nocardiopsis mwathae TaxID=1472723 RepID=A0A7X0D6I9_9ACTN|nr:ATP-binding protein [Nocardiopsis mwathae]MBB6173358.1 anti-sigma regulatory factor (Ser/Thr protein kinase) [Nocardiopsis mwathae]
MRAFARTFPGRAESAAQARHWLRELLDHETCGAKVPTETAETAYLLLSELATNAAQHTASGRPGGYFSVFARFTTSRLRIEVTDEPDLGDPPAPAPARPRDESGRGLGIVAALSTRCGDYRRARSHTVFFELAHGSRRHGNGNGNFPPPLALPPLRHWFQRQVASRSRPRGSLAPARGPGGGGRLFAPSPAIA